MMALFVPALCAALNSTTAPRVVPVSPERLAVLLRRLETSTKRGDSTIRQVEQDCLNRAEYWELEAGGREVVPGCVAVFENRALPQLARADAVKLLVKQLRGYFRDTDSRVLAAVLAAMDDADPAIRVAAIGDLSYCSAGIHCPDGVWMPSLLHPTRIMLNPEAYRAIHPKIVAAVGDPDDRVATAAANSVWYYQADGVGVDELLKNLDRNCPALQAQIVTALASVGKGDPRSFKAVEAVLAKSAEPKVQVAAIDSLKRYGRASPRSFERIGECMRQEREKGESLLVRGHAMATLEALYRKGKLWVNIAATVPELRQLAESKGYQSKEFDLPQLRWRAAKLLERADGN